MSKAEQPTESKWITFTLAGNNPKTKIFTVMAKEGGFLGTVKWYAPWRKYCFVPADYTVFEQDCLRDIADFIERETAEHKRKAKEAKQL